MLSNSGAAFVIAFVGVLGILGVVLSIVILRNTGPKSNLQVFQTLPCLGLIEYSPKDQVSLKNTIGATD